MAGLWFRWTVVGGVSRYIAASAPEKEYGYRNGQLLVTATGRFNVALAANGAVATASSAHTCCGFSTTGAINGNNRGPWGNGEGWNDATPNSVPDWIQVDFAGSKTIDEISVFSLHDNYTQENTPTESQTFTLYGLLAFDVQYWNGSSWTTIPGGSVTGNNKVSRRFTFSPITTNKIRVWINSVPDSWSRVVEIITLKGDQVSLADIDFTNVGLGPAKKLTVRFETNNDHHGNCISGKGNKNRGASTPIVSENETYWVQLNLLSNEGPLDGTVILECHSVFDEKIIRRYRVIGDASNIQARHITISTLA